MVIKPCHFVVGLFHIYTSQYWVLKQGFYRDYVGTIKQNNKAIMKTIETITIINGSLFGKDSITFNTQADYENHINALIDYVESRKQEGFKSLITENCIAWKDAEVITICAIK